MHASATLATSARPTHCLPLMLYCSSSVALLEPATTPCNTRAWARACAAPAFCEERCRSRISTRISSWSSQQASPEHEACFAVRTVSEQYQCRHACAWTPLCGPVWRRDGSAGVQTGGAPHRPPEGGRKGERESSEHGKCGSWILWKLFEVSRWHAEVKDAGSSATEPETKG